MEERTDKGMDQKEKRKQNVKLGGRIASGGHCRLFEERLITLGPVITKTEGLNGVNRQPSNSQNNQPLTVKNGIFLPSTVK